MDDNIIDLRGLLGSENRRTTLKDLREEEPVDLSVFENRQKIRAWLDGITFKPKLKR